MSIELESSQKISPMMEQWHQCKKNAKDALLFFRMGDFYEAFYDDALTLAKELDLTLTQRQGIPMSGVPWHTADPYIDRLINKGYKVAIAEQMENPKEVKGIVKREIVRILTPGTIVSSSLVCDKRNNYLVALAQLGSIYGLSSIDLSTGEFQLIELEDERDLLNEIYRLHPSECLASERFKAKHPLLFKELSISINPLISVKEDAFFDHQSCYKFLKTHFKVQHLDGFGLKGMGAAIIAAGAILIYLKQDLCLPIEPITTLKPYSIAESLSMDKICQRNLELIESSQDGSSKNTLLEILDHTQTPMGGRLLRKWIQHPLIDPTKISNRFDAVEQLLKHPLSLDSLVEELPKIRDLERLMMRINSSLVSPRDLLSLALSLEQIPKIHSVVSSLNAQLLQEAADTLENLQELTCLIKSSIVDEPPLRANEGYIFREGYHTDLDELRSISHNGKSWMAQYQNRLKEETGIKTLKVGFNKVFGYFIEVSKGQADRMPVSFLRRQTLVNTERFISPELKEYEDKVLHAEERMIALESTLFQTLRSQIIGFSEKILKIASGIAIIDCLISLAEYAKSGRYCRPIVDESNILFIEEGRHPVVEEVVSKELFTPNDTYLNDKDSRLMLITGPNMSGKSTYIRQVALIVIMAQMGSFVPAKKAHIGIINKIFTRIGASDDLSRGQSTFMVEMSETANILNNATSRSLVILDEIGRGTSTYDGISIAWSVAEYLLLNENRLCKTLFATHYWELTKLEEQIEGAVNYTVIVKECNDEILFTHKIEKGTSDRSYGIHVGRLAGLPLSVISRAQEILSQLEKNDAHKEKNKKLKQAKDLQLSFF